MATDQNFRIKNGLTVGTVEVIDSSGKLTSNAFGTNSNEKIEDVVADMITGSTHSNITVTYNDTNGTLAFSAAAQYGDSDVESYLDGGTSTPVFSTISSGAITSSGPLTLNDTYAFINAGTTSNTTLERVIWARSQIGASVVQMNVQGDEWQFGGGGTLDTTPILKLKHSTNAATFAGTISSGAITTTGITVDSRLIIDGSKIYDNPTNGNNKGFRIGGSGLVPLNGSGTDTTNLVDIGASTVKFKDLYLSGTISSGAITSSGNVTSSTTGTGNAKLIADGGGAANVEIDRGSTSYHNNLLYRTAGAVKWRIWQSGADNILAIRNEVASTNVLSFTDTNATFAGTISATTVNTGQGANELYAMNQNVRTTDSPTFAGLTTTGNIVAEDSEVHVGDTSGDNWTRIKHAQADGYGFDWQHDNATVIVNEQGSTNQVMILGDVDAANYSGLFGVAHSADTGTSWTKKLDLRGNGELYIGASGTNQVYHEGHKPTYSELGTMAYSNLTGTPTIPSLSGYATESYVGTQISNLVDSAPGSLDTLNELAAALGDDANFSTTVTNSIATKLPLAGGTLTGALNAGGGINGLTISNGISGNNFNITGVNQLTINDPGEGIVFGGGSTTMTLAIVDDATDRILRYSGTGAVFDVQGNITLTGTVTASGGNSTNWNTAYGWGNHASAGYLTSFDITTQTDSKYLRSDAADTATGLINFNNRVNIGNSVTRPAALNSDSVAQARIGGSDVYLYVASLNSTGGYKVAVQAARASDFASFTLNLQSNGGALQRAGNTVWDAGNDGPSSGLNADLLDDQHGSYYTNASNLGSGTVPDARLSSNVHLVTSNPSTPGNGNLSIGYDGSTYSYVQSHSSKPLRLNPAGNSVQIGSGNTVWHAGNDGPSSGLNADLLDGFEREHFTHAEDAKVWTGINSSGTQAKRYHIARLYGCPAHWDSNWQNIEFIVTAESYESAFLKFRLMGDYGGAGSQANMIKLYLQDAQGPLVNSFRFVLGSPVDAGWDYSGQDTFYVDLYAEARYYGQYEIHAKTYGHVTQSSNPTSGGATTVFYGSPTTTNISDFSVNHIDPTFRGYKIWHAGNDSANSGLDADLLDGQEGSYYLNYNNLTNTPSASANYYLNGISKSGNTLTFSVNGATNQTYTFGSNAFNSTTIPTNYITNNADDTMAGNLTIDKGTSTTLSVKCDDGGNALVRAGGDGQGTGIFEVTQDNGSHGGGMSYNGDGSPTWASGETADNVTFYRIDSGTRTEVFHYPYSSNTVNFNDVPTVGGSLMMTAANIGSYAASWKYAFASNNGTNNGGNVTASSAQDGIYFNGTNGITTSASGTTLTLSGANLLRSDVSDNYAGRTLSFGVPGQGTTTTACFASIEGNTDGSGEGSGRLFFREHNSTTGSMDAYGMSLGYRGGATSVTTAGGNSWTGLSQIGNGEWGMWGHNGDNTGNLIMHGPRDGSYLEVDGNLEVNNGATTTLSVRGSGTGQAKIWARCSSQGTGMVMVSQDDDYGGGIEYNGDNNPSTTGAGADYITLFRVSGGTYSWTARNNYANNDWEFRGNVTAYASDERLKENIEPIHNAVEKVKQLRGVTFDWKDDCEDKGFMPTMKHETGVIAQDVQKVIPDAAVPAPFDEDYLTVKHEKIIPVLIEAVKEQQEQIEELKSIINTLVESK